MKSKRQLSLLFLTIMGLFVGSGFAVTRWPVAKISGTMGAVDAIAANNGVLAVSYSNSKDQVQLYSIGNWNLLATLTIPNSKLVILAVAIGPEYIAVAANNGTAPGSDGVVYIFPKPSGGWASEGPSATLTQSDPGSADSFGTTVALWGGTLVGGAPAANNYAGKAYIFEEPTGGWVNSTENAQLSNNDPNFAVVGGSVAITGQVGSNGDLIVLSSQNYHENGKGPGALFVYEEPNGGWQTMMQTVTLSSAQFTLQQPMITESLIASVGWNWTGTGVNLFFEPSGGWQNASGPNLVMSPVTGQLENIAMTQNGQEIVACCGHSSKTQSGDLAYLWHSTNWGSYILLNANGYLPKNSFLHVPAITRGWVFINDDGGDIFIFNGK